MRKQKKRGFSPNYLNLILGFSLLLFLNSCGNNKNTGSQTEYSTPYSGNTVIAVDETFKPIIDSQITVFEKTYLEAKIKAHYLPEGKAVQALINDSVQLAIISRKLTDKEDKYFRARNYIPVTSVAAKDGVAVILHPSNPDTIMTFQELEQILNGTIPSWKKFNPKSKLDKIQLVFDHGQSSTYRFLQEKFNLNGKMAENTFSAETNEKVIDYVSKTPGAIGFIGVNYISDSDDSKVTHFKKLINIVAIYPKAGMRGAGEAYQPYQAYLAQEVYPLTRYVYTISTEPRSGLVTGFASFVNGPVGQKIFLKSGLVPARNPIRIVKISQ